MSHCLLGLGANLGDRLSALQQAVSTLARWPNTRVVRVSRCYATTPVGGPPGQPEFLNAAVLLETSFAPRELLAELQQLERHLGRERTAVWGPRTVDLDLLLFDQQTWHDAELQLPHRWFAARRFALDPAAEIAPAMIHPLLGWTVGALAAHLRDVPPRFTVVGVTGVTWSAALVAPLAGELIADPLQPPLWQTVGSTTLTATHPLECWERRAAELRRHGWLATGAEAQRLRIANFGLEEWVALSAVTTDGEGEASERGEWRTRLAREVNELADAAPPRLMILAAPAALGFDLANRRSRESLAVETSRWPAAVPEPAAAPRELRGRWVDALVHEVLQRRRCPIVQVTAPEGADLERELVGALLAASAAGPLPLGGELDGGSPH